MAKFVNSLYKNQALFYKIFLFIITAVLIVYMLPKGGKFKYEIPKGKPWQYENLYAPFDFAILKTEEEIESERNQITNNHTPYFNFEQNILPEIKEQANEEIELVFTDSILDIRQSQIEDFVQLTLDEIYQNGVLDEDNRLDDDQLIYLRKGNEAFEISYRKILKLGDVRGFLNEKTENSGLTNVEDELLEVFFNVIEPNVSYDSEFSQRDLESKLNNISYTRGNIEQGSRLISKGEVVEGTKYNILRSLMFCRTRAIKGCVNL